MRLTKKDFIATDNIANVLTPLASIKVPRGLACIINRGTTFSMQLATTENFDIDEDTTGTRTAIEKLLSTKVSTANIPEKLKIMCFWNGNLVDFIFSEATNKVTAEIDEEEGILEVHYLIDEGYFQFVISAPGRIDAKSIIYNDDLLGLHNTDQQKNPLMISTEELLLQDFELYVYVDCPVSINWDSPLTKFRSEFVDLPMELILTQAINQGAKGTKKEIESFIIQNIVARWSII